MTLLAIFVAALAATVYFCRTMSGGMEMPGGWTMSMMWMRMPNQSWPAATMMFLLSWLAMMVAMMLPSSLPMVLRFHSTRRVGNAAGAMGDTLLMVGGYFLVWCVAGAMIYPLGIGYAFAAMRWEALSRATPLLIGTAVLIAGAMQFTAWTRRGLNRCRGPMSCSALQPPSGAPSPWRVGINCGVCCVACCSGPMLALVALGMMSPVVMGIVALVIAMEKLMPQPTLTVRIAGVAAVVAGLFMIVTLAA